jgi:hypothetical protein
LYILNFICKETNEHLYEPRKFTREEGQLFLDNVVGQSLALYDREEGIFYNYTFSRTKLISPKTSKVSKRYNLYFEKNTIIMGSI